MSFAPSPYYISGLALDPRPAGGPVVSAEKPSVGRVATPAAISGTRALLDPGNPMFWFGIVLFATFGFIGAAGAIRVGPARASASLGST